MITFGGLDFSCIKCVTGHRAITCTHISTQLTELKPKGRPSTQCGQCKTSRNVTQNHHQCLCGDELSMRKKRVEFKFASGLSFVGSFDAARIAEITYSIVAGQNKGVVKVTRKNLETKKYEDVKSISIEFVCVEELETKETLEHLERMIVNPCRCHSGEPCICASLPAKPSKRKIKDNNLFNKITNEALKAISSVNQTTRSHPYFTHIQSSSVSNENPVNSCCGTVDSCCDRTGISNDSIFKPSALTLIKPALPSSCCATKSAARSCCKSTLCCGDESSCKPTCKCNHSSSPATRKDACGCGCGEDKCEECITQLCDPGLSQFLND